MLLLEEVDAPFEVELIDLKSGAQNSVQFRQVNPKGKVPALQREDGSVLTEFTAIAFWLARRFPEAELMGSSLEAQARTLELVDFIVASIHMRGFTFFKVPHKFSPTPDVQSAIAAHGRAAASAGLTLLSEHLGVQDYLLGAFTIADAAAWYVLRWAIADEMDLPENLMQLYARIEKRRARNNKSIGNT